MKPAAIIFSLLLAPLVLRAGDLQITAERKRSDGSHAVTQYKKQPVKGLVSETSAQEEKWQYAVKIVNNGFKATPALQVQYIVYVQRQQLGEKVGTEVMDKVKGSASLPAIESHANASFDTSEVTLKSHSLMGTWIYSNGGRIKAADNLQGIWVKLFDGATEVADFANPPTLTSKYKWEK